MLGAMKFMTVLALAVLVAGCSTSSGTGSSADGTASPDADAGSTADAPAGDAAAEDVPAGDVAADDAAEPGNDTADSTVPVEETAAPEDAAAADITQDAGPATGDVAADVDPDPQCGPVGAVGCESDDDCCGAGQCIGAQCGPDGTGSGGVCSDPTRPTCGCGAAWQDCDSAGMLCVAAGCDYPGVCLTPEEIVAACADPDVSDCLECPVCDGVVCTVPAPQCTEFGVRTYSEQWLGCGDDGACEFAFDTTACQGGETCADGACAPEPDGACEPTMTSGLDGVSIVLQATDCSFTLAEAAAGITFSYTLIVDAPVQQVVPATQDAGGCGQPGAGGLIIFNRIQGGEQSWCICDTGLCMGPDDTPVTLDAGAWGGSFEWDGVNWFGPSDFGNPKGDSFPVGTYTVTISAKGTRDGAAFEVLNSFEIELTD